MVEIKIYNIASADHFIKLIEIKYAIYLMCFLQLQICIIFSFLSNIELSFFWIEGKKISSLKKIISIIN